MPRNVLVAGPYVGELGWELMEWSGYVRKLSTTYRRTIAISYEGNAWLYEPCEYYAHSATLADSGYGYGSLPRAQINTILNNCATAFKIKSFDWFFPEHLNAISKQLIGGQLFWAPFEQKRRCIYDVAFHFRNIRRSDLESKNYPIEFAYELIERCKNNGISVCCIGHRNYSLCPDNCTDFRTNELSETRAVLRSVMIVAGGSSGPMHLASLCGLAVVVWCTEGIVDRYISTWNPHQSPVFVVSEKTFQPTPVEVFYKINEALKHVAS